LDVSFSAGEAVGEEGAYSQSEAFLFRLSTVAKTAFALLAARIGCFNWLFISFLQENRPFLKLN
jgi:hypothetical protein